MPFHARIFALCLVLSGSLTTNFQAQAAPDIARFTVSELGRLPPIFGYAFEWETTEGVEGQNTRLGAQRHQADLIFPIWQNSNDEIAWLGVFDLRTLDSAAILPADGEPLPGELWNIRFGPSYRHRFGNGWKAGGNLMFGSASDKPFSAFRDTEFMTNLFFSIPSRKNNAWIFLLNYSNNREFLNNIPLPGFGYYWSGNRWFEGILGIPFFQGELFPGFPARLSFSYFPARNVELEARYAPIPQWEVFGGFRWFNDEYFLNARQEEDFRLFYYEKRLTGGVRIRPLRWMELELAGGYAFDRFFFEAKDYGDRSQNQVILGNAVLTNAKLGLRF